ncbi:MAG: ribonucleotide-diphosphate reductase subunit beta, partial [Bacteroidota bacterium]
MALLNTRVEYAPFEYQQAYRYWELQQQSHWLHHEIAMAGDIQDWKENLTESEKNVIAGILKGFTQAEILIEDYWSNKVCNWFKKPEIQMMGNTFAAFESIHA